MWGVAWNRRKRRSIARAKPGEVMIHVFAGSQRWKGVGQVVEVEKCRGVDLLGIVCSSTCWGGQ